MKTGFFLAPLVAGALLTASAWGNEEQPAQGAAPKTAPAGDLSKFLDNKETGYVSGKASDEDLSDEELEHVQRIQRLDDLRKQQDVIEEAAGATRPAEAVEQVPLERERVRRVEKEKSVEEPIVIQDSVIDDAPSSSSSSEVESLRRENDRLRAENQRLRMALESMNAEGQLLQDPYERDPFEPRPRFYVPVR